MEMSIFELLILPAALMPRGLSDYIKIMLFHREGFLCVPPSWSCSSSGQYCRHADRSLVTTGTHCLDSPQKGSSLLQRLHALPHCFISPQVPPHTHKIFVQVLYLASTSSIHEQPA